MSSDYPLKRESDTSFLTSGFYYNSVSSGLLSIPLGPFQIFIKIHGDICNFVTPATSWSLVSTTPVKNNCRGRFYRRVTIAGVVDFSCMFISYEADDNLLPITTITEINSGNNNTGDNFLPATTTPAMKQLLHISLSTFTSK
jgi:hypothetical protein